MAGKESLVKGGYYLKARCIQESEIAHLPPHVREIWDWLIKECNHKPRKIYGRMIERGQRLTSYKEIQEALHWTIGWRKMQYSKGNCETAMKLLKKRTMVTAEKTTRGFLVTVCNYDYYQNPENYVTDKVKTKQPTGEPQPHYTINKNEKNDNKKEEYIPDWIPKKEWNNFKEMRAEKGRPVTSSMVGALMNKLMNLQASGEDLKEVINYSIRNQYTDFFSVKKKQAQKTSNSNLGNSEKDDYYDKRTH